MQVCKTVNDIKLLIKSWKEQGAIVGFVPTMGYLHSGHGSLVTKSISENTKTVASIFVNPTQFAPNEDLASYPRDYEKDKTYLEELGADALFFPSAEEIYGSSSRTFVYVDKMSEKLCGKTRPTHFQGVTTVIAKFFNIITPHKAYFGLKDFQQFAIISKMTADLNFDVDVVGCPIVRGDEGLALSSRNIYLSDEEKESALILNQSLNYAKKMIDANEKKSFVIIDKITRLITSTPNTKIDYVKIVHRNSLEDLENVIHGETAVALAVYVGKARLIDNILV